MSAFDLDQQGWTDRVNDARLTPQAPVDDSPSLFAGGWRAAGEGFMRGGARVAQFAGMAAAPAVVLADKLAGRDHELTDAYFHKLDDVVNDAVNFWTPDAHSLGAGARALGGLSESLLPLMAGGGSPSLLIGTSTVGTATDLTREGVDAPTAVGAGTVQGLATAAGFKVPIIGKTLLQRGAAGVVGNVAFGAASREAQHEFLKQRGYQELASNYSPIDGEALAVDAITGAMFGGLYHLAAPSEIAGTATINNAKHFQVDTAPGGIADVHASAAHQQAMQDGLEQAMRGEPVNVPAEVLDANFVKRPPREVPVPDEYRELDTNRAAEDAHQAEQAATDAAYSVAEGELTDEQLAQFQGLRSDVQGNQDLRGPGEGVPGQPGHPNDGGSGGEPLQVFRGSSRKLSAQDFGEGALGHATGHPSSGLGVFFTNEAERAAQYGKVSEHHLDIRNPKVIPVDELPGFDSLEEAAAFRKKLQAEGFDGIVIDASHLGGTVDYVAFSHDQVLAAKKTSIASDPRLQDPAVREDLQALRDQVGLTEKGGRSIVDPDTGKVVGRTKHLGSPLWMQRPGSSEGRGISAKNAIKALDNVRDGKPLGAEQERFVKYALDEHQQIRGEQHDFVNDAMAPELTPEVAAAHEYLTRDDIQVPTGAVDAEGNPIMRSAREMLAQAEQDVQTAHKDAQGIAAAVSCFLTRGIDAR